jgi:hypothetical protein
MKIRLHSFFVMGHGSMVIRFSSLGIFFTSQLWIPGLDLFLGFLLVQFQGCPCYQPFVCNFDAVPVRFESAITTPWKILLIGLRVSSCIFISVLLPSCCWEFLTARVSGWLSLVIHSFLYWRMLIWLVQNSVVERLDLSRPHMHRVFQQI